MNKKAGFVLRLVAGMYLTYLGIQLIMEVTEQKPSNLVFCIVMAVVFIIVGVGYAAFSIRGAIRIYKEENPKTDADNAGGISQATDPSLFVTAPMPVINEAELGTVKKENAANSAAKVTLDLREEEEEQAAVQQEAEEVKKEPESKEN